MKTDPQTRTGEAWRWIDEPARNGPSAPVPLSGEVNGPMLADRAKWETLIDATLMKWLLDPSQLDEPDTETPSRETIQRAILLARHLRDLPPPTSIVPDAHGGIVFERKQNGIFETIRLSADGHVEHCLFEDCRQTQRDTWPVDFHPDLHVS